MKGLSFVSRSKADGYRRQFVASEASADLLWNDTSIATFALDDDHPAVAQLVGKGARCSVLLDGAELFRGRVARSPGTMPKGRIDFSVECDLRKFREWLGWPKPTAAYTAQDVEYRHYTGSTEKVVKDALGEAVARLGASWGLAPNLNRGRPSAVADLRMHPLGDKLFPLLKEARLTAFLSYSPTPVFDVRVPRTINGILDPRTGVVDAFSFDRFAPSATRVVVGGRGDGVEREFFELIDDDREEEWEDIIEVFRDARNTEEGESLEPEAQRILGESDAGASVSMDLVETSRFRFRTHYDIGDVLPVNIGGVPASEVVTRVTVTDTVGAGVTVTPHIGAFNYDPIAQIGERISALKTRVRELGRR